jgi:flagellar motility protein MotE (MotC chaperone)
MMLRLPTPRLLPITIVALAVLLGMKSVELVRAAAPGGAAGTPAAAPAVAPAQAATPEQPASPAKPATVAPTAALSPAAAPAPQPSGATQSPGSARGEPPPISDSERTVLLELRQRRQELDAREATLATRESVLAATDRKLADRVTELQTLQHRLETLEAARQQREDAGWQGLVKTYETMKPRDAATIFNDLEMPVLLQIVDRMKDAKAAPILAGMQPDKARELTTQLAQLRSHRETPATSGG